MYSVKPGRGPSMMGVVGGIAAAVFGVIWMMGAASAGAPPSFTLFGLVFVGLAIAGVVYNACNATQKNRMSEFDITTPDEEQDPIARALGHAPRAPGNKKPESNEPRKFEGEFCPFCGARARPDFDYCPKCGKDI
ncbi:MAG: zinc ribbon domain-containing protein [Planctomycetes bacterium]|jgi:hypothetical protein|nr:zinc ribbon domain-containing protein [Planctomycetota bacterium]